VCKKLFWPYVIGPALGLSQDPTKLGKWAIITGATDGIGKAYARALAKKGMKVYLLSRTQEKLDTVADEIRKESLGTEVQTYQVDFGTSSLAIFENMKRVFGDMDVGVLVNNVGMSYPYPDYFINSNLAVNQKVMNTNNLSMVGMSSVVLPGMVRRNRGAIINIASTAGFRPLPMLNIYSSTKAFAQFFSRAVGYETVKSNLIVQTLMPAFVVTNMSGLRRSTFFHRDPNDFVQEALGSLGLASFTTGCFAHELQHAVTSLIPERLMVMFAMRLLTKNREKALKRMAKEN
jgi:17beta-estradiol 17-dehydrogenase / very-long-chain 3-oxoacyl-CoA reductase